jgi:hypothetical protein
VNRVLPRKKDYIPVNVSGTKTQEEKWRVLVMGLLSL